MLLHYIRPKHYCWGYDHDEHWNAKEYFVDQFPFEYGSFIDKENTKHTHDDLKIITNQIGRNEIESLEVRVVHFPKVLYVDSKLQKEK